MIIAISALVLTLMLAVAPPAAEAQCAWVLWVEETKTARVENKTRTSERWETHRCFIE